MATERIVTQISHDKRVTLRRKFEQYDWYLISGRYAKTYQSYEEFRHFTMLFVTQKEERIDNILQAVSDLPEKLHYYYRFTTFSEALGDFLGPVWKSRLISDTKRYALARQGSRMKICDPLHRTARKKTRPAQPRLDWPMSASQSGVPPENRNREACHPSVSGRLNDLVR